MKTNVIILAQGSQKRLPNLPVAKQMLPLPHCNGVPIMYRTVRQCWKLLAVTPETLGETAISIITWSQLADQITRQCIPVEVSPHVRALYHPQLRTLADPGNSSLKGIERYLRTFAGEVVSFNADRTVVLFGDVVYSWQCLGAIFAGSHWHFGFVGTSDLSTSGGELWGIQWMRSAQHNMLECLNAALKKHPPFDSNYQCGQMRRWLWAVDDTMRAMLGPAFEPRNWYKVVDDYTRDIDLPEHVDLLSQLSYEAMADDLTNGVTW